jgi:hypothetical protein
VRRSVFRYLILLFALMLNLAIAKSAWAGLKSDTCEDPETGLPVDCCVWCLINCDCDLVPSP